MKFQEMLNRIIKKNNSLVCVGLDSEFDKVQAEVQELMKNLDLREKKKLASRGDFNMIFLFNKHIIEATHDLVCSYKLNTAFYESTGLKGLLQLKLTTKFLKDEYPEIPIIIDAKRGDIGNTNRGYVQFIFDFLEGDAVTVNPYLGEEAIGPFLERKDKGIIVLCRTSNPGAGEFQDLVIRANASVISTKSREAGRVEKSNKDSSTSSSTRFARSEFARNDNIEGMKLYQYVAYQVSHKWNKNKNCFLVVGATYPEELKEVRKIVGQEMTILVPGIGVQGGNLEAALKAGLNKKKTGLIINSSRGIIFAKNPRLEARKLKETINKYRK